MSKTNRWHIVGLVAWGIGCGRKGVPAVYVNVFHYLNWITNFYDVFKDPKTKKPREKTPKMSIHDPRRPRKSRTRTKPNLRF